MGTDKWTAAAFLVVYVGVRIVDLILPGGHHWRRMDRWLRRDDKADTDEP